MTIISGAGIVENYYSGREREYFLNPLLTQELDADSCLSSFTGLIHLLAWQPLCCAWKFTTNPIGILSVMWPEL